MHFFSAPVATTDKPKFTGMFIINSQLHMMRFMWQEVTYGVAAWPCKLLFRALSLFQASLTSFFSHWFAVFSQYWTYRALIV